MIWYGCSEVRREEVSQTRGLGQGSDFYLPVADFVRKPASQGSRKGEAAFDDTRSSFWSGIPGSLQHRSMSGNLQHGSMPTPLKDESW